jgi:glucose-1-phosphate thymidylyltransferase
MNIAGLIPAGGVARRLGKVPCSKEVFPVVNRKGEVKVTSSNLISYFRKAGISNIYFIISKGKWDIPDYFGDGTDNGVNISYLITNLPYGTPFTLDQAFSFVKDKIVALGYPDLIVHPENAFETLSSCFKESNADIFLGVVPSSEYLKSDMLEFNEEGLLKNIIIKQNRPDLKYSWFGALWKPSFTEFMHEFLHKFIIDHPNGNFRTPDGITRELYVGDVIQAAISNDLKVDYHIFPEGSYLDLGTPATIRNLMNL